MRTDPESTQTPERPADLSAQAAWGYVRHVVQLAATVILTPQMLKFLGTEGFGYWSASFALVGLLCLLDVGIGTTLVRFCARAVGAGQLEERNRTASSLLGLATALALLAGILSVLALQLFPSLMNKAGAHLPGAELCLILLLLRGVILQIPAGLFRGLLFAEHQLIIADQIQILATFIYGIGLWQALRHGFGLVGAAWVNLGAMVFEHAAYAVACWVLLPNLRLSPGLISISTVTAVLPFALRQATINVATFINHRMDLMIVGWMFGLVQVAIYGLALKIVEAVQMFFKQGVNILAPRFARLSPEKWPTEGAQQVLESSATIVRMTLLTSVLLGVVAADLLQVWVGTGYSDTVPVLWTLLAAAVLNMLVAVPSVALAMCDSDEAVSRAALWSTVTNLALSFALGKLVGPIGVALATTLSQALVTAPWLMWSCWKRFGINPGRFLVTVLLPNVPVVGAIALEAFWVRSAISPEHSATRVALTSIIGGALWGALELGLRRGDAHAG